MIRRMKKHQHPHVANIFCIGILKCAYECEMKTGQGSKLFSEGDACRPTNDAQNISGKITADINGKKRRLLLFCSCWVLCCVLPKIVSLFSAAVLLHVCTHLNITEQKRETRRRWFAHSYN